LGEAEAPPSASSPGTPVACALGNGAKVKQKFGGSVKLPFPPGIPSGGKVRSGVNCLRYRLHHKKGMILLYMLLMERFEILSDYFNFRNP
jgi:hypothetical protein